MKDYGSRDQLVEIVTDILLEKLAGQENLTRHEDTVQFRKLFLVQEKMSSSLLFVWTTGIRHCALRISSAARLMAQPPTHVLSSKRRLRIMRPP